VPHCGLGLDGDELDVVVDGVDRLGSVLDLPTTTAAISIGLPSASLTLACADSWLRILVETLMRSVNGFTHFRPESRIVPRYRPNSWTTRAWPGTTAVSPRHARMAARRTTTPIAIMAAFRSPCSRPAQTSNPGPASVRTTLATSIRRPDT